jgi:imidazolonepropionase-like amidohydrolase
MRKSKHLFTSACLVMITFLFHGIVWDVQADRASREPPVCCLLRADRLFDGIKLYTDAALLLTKDKVAQLGTIEQLQNTCHRKLELGDATILPGFIESHAHVTFQNVSPLTVLRHGVTTVREVGGPLLAPMGGDGTLRLLSSGPIIQAPNGYPLNIFGGGSGGYDQIGIPVAAPSEARTVVQHLVEGGAAIIKIALEPGGEEGAPWSMTHGHYAPPATPWPMLSLDTVQAIVNEAHALGKRVAAHVSENRGAALALDGDVDEWAHVPCATIDEDVLQRAVDQGSTIVTTIDTLGACKGIHANTMRLAAKGALFIYGSEIGHRCAVGYQWRGTVGDASLHCRRFS